MKTAAQAANQLYPPEPPLSFPPIQEKMANQLYPPEPPLSFPPAAPSTLADQLYPPEPPLSFPPVHDKMANQLYPPEPPLSFPPAHQVMADQLYPPEPPLSFPPLPSLEITSSGKRVVLSNDLVDETALAAGDSMKVATADTNTQSGLRVNEALLGGGDSIVNSVESSRVFALTSPPHDMDLSQVYMAGGLFMIVVATLLVAVGRRGRNKEKGSAKQDGDRTVVFTDSYAPFLG